MISLNDDIALAKGEAVGNHVLTKAHQWDLWVHGLSSNHDGDVFTHMSHTDNPKMFENVACDWINENRSLFMESGTIEIYIHPTGKEDKTEFVSVEVEVTQTIVVNGLDIDA